MGETKRRKTLKMERWEKAYLESGNATGSAREVYDVKHPKSASVIGSTNLRKLRADIEEAREREGLSWLTPEYVLSKINEIAGNPAVPYRAKLYALELLGKSLALFTEKIEMREKIIGIIGQLQADWRESQPTEPLKGDVSDKDDFATLEQPEIKSENKSSAGQV